MRWWSSTRPGALAACGRAVSVPQGGRAAPGRFDAVCSRSMCGCAYCLPHFGGRAVAQPERPVADGAQADPVCARLTARAAPPARRCGHCKHLTPEFKKLGAQVSGDPKLSSRVVVAKVRGRAAPGPTAVGERPSFLLRAASKPASGLKSCECGAQVAQHPLVWRSPVRGGGTRLAVAGALNTWRHAQVDADAHREIGERFGVTARARPSPCGVPRLPPRWRVSIAACMRPRNVHIL